MAFIISVLRRCLRVACEGTGRARLIGGSLAAGPLIAAVCVVVGAGCSTTSMGEAPVAPGDSAASAAAADNNVAAVATPEDLKRLDKLWEERADLASIEKDYPICPGAVLSLSGPQRTEL